MGRVFFLETWGTPRETRHRPTPLVGSQGVQSLESIDVLRFCVFSRLDDISEGSKPRGFLFGLEERKQWGEHDILDLRQRASDDGSAIGVPYSLGAGWSRGDFAVDEVNLSSGWGGVHIHDLRTAHGIVGSTDAKGLWKITFKKLDRYEIRASKLSKATVLKCVSLFRWNNLQTKQFPLSIPSKFNLRPMRVSVVSRLLRCLLTTIRSSIIYLSLLYDYYNLYIYVFIIWIWFLHRGWGETVWLKFAGLYLRLSPQDWRQPGCVRLDLRVLQALGEVDINHKRKTTTQTKKTVWRGQHFQVQIRSRNMTTKKVQHP